MDLWPVTGILSHKIWIFSDINLLFLKKKGKLVAAREGCATRSSGQAELSDNKPDIAERLPTRRRAIAYIVTCIDVSYNTN